MKIQLRPHHFLCLQGYKGLNYSKTQANSWAKICDVLNKKPNTDILIINSSDDLCKKCPTVLKNEKSRCIENNVKNLDEIVAQKLDIKTGNVYKYSDIVKKMNNLMTKQLHEKLCSKCAWWIKGLCRDSFNK